MASIYSFFLNISSKSNYPSMAKEESKEKVVEQAPQMEDDDDEPDEWCVWPLFDEIRCPRFPG